MVFNYTAATDLERNEQIALRLGWICKPQGAYKEWFTPRGESWTGQINCNYPKPLPNWTTNNGLAFAELWPKIVEVRPEASLYLKRDQKDAPTVYTTQYMVTGKSWAEAICRAFIELVPLPEEVGES